MSAVISSDADNISKSKGTQVDSYQNRWIYCSAPYRIGHHYDIGQPMENSRYNVYARSIDEKLLLGQ